MEENNLITMANQIGGFFKSYPDKEQATKDIATHLKDRKSTRLNSSH